MRLAMTSHDTISTAGDRNNQRKLNYELVASTHCLLAPDHRISKQPGQRK
jgi:hypothetical protein